MWKRIFVTVIFTGLTALAFAGADEGAIMPHAFSGSEIATLEARQEADLDASDWGEAFAEVRRMRDIFVAPRPIGAAEAQILESQVDPQLGKVVAMGDGSVGQRILFFLPDRILDTLDTVSFIVPVVVFWVPLEVHITRYASLGVDANVGITLSWLYNRNLPLMFWFGAAASAGPYHLYNRGFGGGGTGWTEGRPGWGKKRYIKAGMFSPDDEMARDGWQDPWGIGAGYWWFDIHPIEIADLVAGLLTFGFADISKDDFANPDRSPYKIGMPVY